MTNQRFYPAKERKNDFIVNVEYLQFGFCTHTIKKTVLDGAKVSGMITWDIQNPNYKTEDEYNKQISKCKTDRLKTITQSKWVYQE